MVKKRSSFKIRNEGSRKAWIIYKEYEVPILKEGGVWVTPFTNKQNQLVVRTERGAAEKAVVLILNTWDQAIIQKLVKEGKIIGPVIETDKPSVPSPAPAQTGPPEIPRPEPPAVPMKAEDEEVAPKSNFERIGVIERREVEVRLYHLTPVYFQIDGQEYVFLSKTSTKIVGNRPYNKYRGLAKESGEPKFWPNPESCEKQVQAILEKWLHDERLPEEILSSIEGNLKRRRIFRLS